MASDTGADPRDSTLSSVWAGFGVSLALLVLLNGGLKFWDGAPDNLGVSTGVGLGCALIVTLIGLRRSRWQLCRLFSNPLGPALALLVLFFSNWLTRSYNLFQGPSIRGEFILGALLMVPLLRINSARYWNWLVVCAVLMVSYSFLSTADGRVLFSDDNATFQYRLQLLKENFPSIPFYSPLWNSGIDARDFFATGALNAFILASPLIYLCNVQECYNLIIVLLVIVLPTASTALAARTLHLAHPAPAFAALLALASTFAWYKWGLKYGTIGFVVSASLVPLSLALVSRFTDPDDPFPWSIAILTVCSISLMIMWSASGLVFIPALLFVLARVQRLYRSPTRIVATIMILALNLPWIIIFLNVSKVANFLKSEQATISAPEIPISQSAEPRASAPGDFKTRAGTVSSVHALGLLRDAATGTNPLLLLLTIPGIALLPRRNRLLIGLTAIWLIALGSLGAMIKPQLELDRMLVMLALVAVLPTSVALRKLFIDISPKIKASRFLSLGSIYLAGGILLTGPFVASAITSNRTLEQFHFASPLVGEITKAINAYGGAGRVLFSGFVLHQLEEGHLAPLVLSGGPPLIASTHVHNLWSYRQIIPKSYLDREPSGIPEYLDLQNVTAVIAHEPEWIDYFARRPAHFQRVWKGGKFVMYKRLKYIGNYFLEGNGQIVAQETNRVRFSLKTPNAILKFNYYPFLEIQRDGEKACTVGPARISPEITFVHVSDCPIDAELELRSVGTWQRLMEHK